jgi:EAL domain-containing protein (putative c-di-GMP-specific phosphodiesterase class I)
MFATLHFAAAAHCEVIAEGIETEGELANVSALGVTLGQGYLLGRPAPAETWPRTEALLGPPRAAGPTLRVERRAAIRGVVRRDVDQTG